MSYIRLRRVIFASQVIFGCAELYLTDVKLYSPAASYICFASCIRLRRVKVSAAPTPYFLIFPNLTGPLMPEAGIAMKDEKPSRIAFASVVETQATISLSFSFNTSLRS